MLYVFLTFNRKTEESFYFKFSKAKNFRIFKGNETKVEWEDMLNHFKFSYYFTQIKGKILYTYAINRL